MCWRAFLPSCGEPIPTRQPGMWLFVGQKPSGPLSVKVTADSNTPRKNATSQHFVNHCTPVHVKTRCSAAQRSTSTPRHHQHYQRPLKTQQPSSRQAAGGHPPTRTTRQGGPPAARPPVAIRKFDPRGDDARTQRALTASGVEMGPLQTTPTRRQPVLEITKVRCRGVKGQHSTAGSGGGKGATTNRPLVER